MCSNEKIKYKCGRWVSVSRIGIINPVCWPNLINSGHSGSRQSRTMPCKFSPVIAQSQLTGSMGGWGQSVLQPACRTNALVSRNSGAMELMFKSISEMDQMLDNGADVKYCTTLNKAGFQFVLSLYFSLAQKFIGIRNSHANTATCNAAQE